MFSNHVYFSFILAMQVVTSFLPEKQSKCHTSCFSNETQVLHVVILKYFCIMFGLTPLKWWFIFILRYRSLVYLLSFALLFKELPTLFPVVSSKYRINNDHLRLWLNFTNKSSWFLRWKLPLILLGLKPIFYWEFPSKKSYCESNNWGKEQAF